MGDFSEWSGGCCRSCEIPCITSQQMPCAQRWEEIWEDRQQKMKEYSASVLELIAIKERFSDIEKRSVGIILEKISVAYEKLEKEFFKCCDEPELLLSNICGIGGCLSGEKPKDNDCNNCSHFEICGGGDWNDSCGMMSEYDACALADMYPVLKALGEVINKVGDKR